MISTIIYSLVSALFALGLLVGLLFIGIKILTKKESTGTRDQIMEKDLVIDSLTKSIGSAVESFESLVSVEELEEIEQAKISLLSELKAVQQKLAVVDKNLAAKQVEVDKAEASQNDLKRAKEAAAALADDLRQNKERLEAESKSLEGELTQSLSQLEALSKELTTNPQVEAGMNKIQSSLVNSRAQLRTLIQLYEQGSNRFLNLQTQYRDLEKEFTKLVERELSG